MNLKKTEMNDIYPVKIEFDAEDNLYVAEFLDLPGCFAPGASVEEAYQRAQEAKEEWIRVAKEQGLPIPAPSRSEEYSGRILLRLPAALHGMLADRAKIQATSLNQYAVHLLSGAVVGDTVMDQIDQLKEKVTSFETQLVRLARKWETSYSESPKQLAGTLPLGSSPSGQAYKEIGGRVQ
jgi:predicted RNase H-like HicB family nuclease